MKNSKHLTTIEAPRGIKPVPGHPGYFVNKTGDVFSIKKLSPMLHGDGYLRVCLYGKVRGRKRLGIHQLVALTFIPNPTQAREVRHLDGNKFHNRHRNLAWGTRAENAADMARHGSVAGENNPKAKLTWPEIHAIRRAYRSGFSTADIAVRFETSWSCIKKIVSGKHWKPRNGNHSL